MRSVFIILSASLGLACQPSLQGTWEKGAGAQGLDDRWPTAEQCYAAQVSRFRQRISEDEALYEAAVRPKYATDPQESSIGMSVQLAKAYRPSESQQEQAQWTIQIADQLDAYPIGLVQETTRDMAGMHDTINASLLEPRQQVTFSYELPQSVPGEAELGRLERTAWYAHLANGRLRVCGSQINPSRSLEMLMDDAAELALYSRIRTLPASAVSRFGLQYGLGPVRFYADLGKKEESLPGYGTSEIPRYRNVNFKIISNRRAFLRHLNEIGPLATVQAETPTTITQSQIERSHRYFQPMPGEHNGKTYAQTSVEDWIELFEMWSGLGDGAQPSFEETMLARMSGERPNVSLDPNHVLETTPDFDCASLDWGAKFAMQTRYYLANPRSDIMITTRFDDSQGRRASAHRWLLGDTLGFRSLREGINAIQLLETNDVEPVARQLITIAHAAISELGLSQYRIDGGTAFWWKFSRWYFGDQDLVEGQTQVAVRLVMRWLSALVDTDRYMEKDPTLSPERLEKAQETFEHALPNTIQKLTNDQKVATAQALSEAYYRWLVESGLSERF